MHYKSLFNINIHHAYFLDEGKDKFTNMSSEEQHVQLKTYDINDYLEIVPTPLTQRILKNFRMHFRSSKDGFRVLVETIENEVLGQKKYSPVIDLRDDLALTFQLNIKDPVFYNYSQVSSVDNEKLYLFSNQKPSLEANSNNILKDNGNVDGDYLMEKDTSTWLMHTVVTETEQLNRLINEHSIAFLDAATINSAPERTIIREYITKQRRKGLLGYVRIYPKGDIGSNTDILEFDNTNPLDIKQYTKDTVPEGTIHFKNRKSYWRYIKTSDSLVYTTKQTKPLTKNGFIEIEDSDLNPDPGGDAYYPNPTPDIIKIESSKYYSEIYI